ncbi:hypothetical protein, variant [Aphanomyces invadans]|nr:hypothetical protein, variant [Aphanomyces invadans]ETV94307.1 hypothetical protein, variant [Aphanomyces invadans]|eukprot:XP_008877068.1 hypothetical protein, variant [Aphanomyces invadans]
MLVAALNLLLQGCLDRGDTKCAKSVMNMAQTFYCIHKQTKHYLLTNLVMHPMWQTAHFWGDAVLLSIGEELSRHPMDTPWQCLSAPARAALVVTVHNVVFGQLTTFVYNMAAFRLSRRQIRQFVQNVAFSFELSEDQRMALLAAVASLSMDESKDDEERAILGGDASLFTTAIFPEWRKTAPPKDSSMHVLVGQGLSRIKGIFDRDLDKASSQVLLANAQKAKNDQWNDLFGEVGPLPPHPAQAPKANADGGASAATTTTQVPELPRKSTGPAPLRSSQSAVMDSQTSGRHGNDESKGLRRRPKSNSAISDFIPPLPTDAPPPSLLSIASPHGASGKKPRPHSSNSVVLAEAAFDSSSQRSRSTSRNRTGDSDDDAGSYQRSRRHRLRQSDATGVAALRARFERMESM